MRLPGGVDDVGPRAHFLTDAYITEFKLPIKKFPNYDVNGLSHIYGCPTTKTECWEKEYFDHVWPKWKQGITGGMAEQIQNIGDYYDKTTGVVTNQLKKCWKTYLTQ